MNVQQLELLCVSAEGANPLPAGTGETLRQKDSALIHFWKMPRVRLPMGQIPPTRDNLSGQITEAHN